MEAEVLEWEERLLFATLEAARVGICVVASDERILLVTSSFAAKLGLAAIDLLGRNARSMLSDARVIPDFDALINLNQAPLAVESVITTDGRLGVLLLQARTVQFDAKTRFRVIAGIELADFGLTATRAQDMRRQFEAISSALVLVDCCMPDMPVVMVNDRFRSMTGYMPEEVIGRNCRFLQGTDRDQPALGPLRQAIASGRPGYAVLRNYRRNGEMFINELFVTPLRDRNGVITHMVGLQREQPPLS